MQTNYEPQHTLSIEELQQITSENENKLEGKAEQKSDYVLSLEQAVDEYEAEKRKPFYLTRQQRRKMVRDSEIKFGKQKKNFGIWASKLELEELDLFIGSFTDFLNYPLPKKDMDLILRSLGEINYTRNTWSPWQLQILQKYYVRKADKVLAELDEDQEDSQ